MSEYRERFTTGEGRRRCKHGIKPRIASGAGDGLGEGTVVGHQICCTHAEMRSCRLVGEIKDLKVDRYPTNTATNFKGIDSFIKEVTEQLRPCALLPVGRIPNPRLPRSVVAARPDGGVGTGCQLVSCGALVPVTARQPSSRCTSDRDSRAHTYEPSTKAAAAL